MTFEAELVFVEGRVMTSARNGREFGIVKLVNPTTYETFEVFADVQDVRSWTFERGTPVTVEFVVRGGNRTTVAVRRVTA